MLTLPLITLGFLPAEEDALFRLPDFRFRLPDADGMEEEISCARSVVSNLKSGFLC